MLSTLVRCNCRTYGVKKVFTSRCDVLRSFRTDSKFTAPKYQQKQATIRERLMRPTSGSPFVIGHGAMIGGSALGLGALCYYGLGLSSEAGILEKSLLWSTQVKDRIATTYMYFGGSVIVTAASAIAAFRSPSIMRLVTSSGFLGIAMSFGAVIGSGMIARGIEYKEGFGAKQLAWMAHAGIIGAFIAPMCALGGPIVLRAACYTAGIFGGLSTIAVCAPSEKFLMMGGALGMGLGVVFVSSLAGMFLPPTTAIGAGLYSISLYGGLLLFSGFLLYDTQRIVRAAELTHYRFDPINQSMSIYMDVLNIFIRMVTILSGTGGSRRK